MKQIEEKNGERGFFQEIKEETIKDLWYIFLIFILIGIIMIMIYLFKRVGG